MESMTCPECKSTNTVKIGKRLTRKGLVQQYQCKKCGRHFQDKYSLNEAASNSQDEIKKENKPK